MRIGSTLQNVCSNTSMGTFPHREGTFLEFSFPFGSAWTHSWYFQPPEAHEILKTQQPQRTHSSACSFRSRDREVQRHQVTWKGHTAHGSVCVTLSCDMTDPYPAEVCVCLSCFLHTTDTIHTGLQGSGPQPFWR